MAPTEPPFLYPPNRFSSGNPVAFLLRVKPLYTIILITLAAKAGMRQPDDRTGGTSQETALRLLQTPSRFQFGYTVHAPPNIKQNSNTAHN